MDLIKGFPATSQNSSQLNISNIIKHAARNFGRQEIVSMKQDGTLFRYTYRDSYERVQRLASSLTSLGVTVGDRIGVLASNSHRNHEMYFGIPGSGAVMVLMNPRFTSQELSYVVNHAGIRFIFVDEDLLHTVEDIAPMCESVQGYVILTDKKLSDVKTKLEPIYGFEECLSNAGPIYEWPNLDETVASSACYTSGTTGRPKGVYYSHRDVYLQAMMYALNAMITMKDCVFQIVPMFHVLGWGTPYSATMVGAKLVLPGRYSLENLDEIIKILVQEKVTLSAGVPSILRAILNHLLKMDPSPDLSGVRFLCGGSEPPLSMMRSFWDATKAEIVHTYGSTEAQAIVTLNLPKPWLNKELTEEERWELKKKQGYIVVGLDVKIVDSSDNELPHDGEAVGEILLRGPWVLGKYHDAPGSEDQFTKDGYFRTGDVGTIDSEGYLKLTDRTKDLIKSGGEWISSLDMENEIVNHPAVLEAAVVGVAHAKWEERPLALVVLRDKFKTKVNKREILEHLATRFAKWQLPDEILFVETIPKTSVGKIDKKAIRAEHNEIYTDN
ncbi:MAG: fatty-acid--CoA ligase [Candidatus Thorarchaeota archaeon]|nr:MAG: fatty-acid--CoA ligase [Candidatus Thorarchaeota archaeon]